MRYDNYLKRITVLAFVLVMIVLLPKVSLGGTCSSLSRSNYVANSVLTSSDLNADLNQILTGVNAFDGGCVTDGTLEDGALNTTDYAVLLNFLREGCKVTRSDAATLSVDKCALSVNGSFVRTTAANTVTWGCTSCSAEAASTTYYIYAKTGSTGTTLNLLISTTAPNNDGYDASSNKVLARFYNNASSDIDQYSIDQWSTNQFIPQDTGWIDSGASSIDATTTAPTKGTVVHDKVFWKRIGDTMHLKFEYEQSAGDATGTGDYWIDLPNSVAVDTSKIAHATIAAGETDGPACGTGFAADNDNVDDVTAHPGGTAQINAGENGVRMVVRGGAYNMTRVWGSASFAFTVPTLFISLDCTIPIAGWGN